MNRVGLVHAIDDIKKPPSSTVFNLGRHITLSSGDSKKPCIGNCSNERLLVRPSRGHWLLLKVTLFNSSVLFSGVRVIT